MATVQTAETTDIIKRVVSGNPLPLPERTRHSHYIYAHGLRIVRPYTWEYCVNAKARWFGRTLQEIYETEFPAFNGPYVARMCTNGNMTINHKPCLPTAVIKMHDIMSHRVHRHERPTLDQPVKFVLMNKDVVIVDKPSSLPVHPTGRYHRNSLMGVLEFEYGLTGLHNVNRIDRVTSGLLIFARNSATAGMFGKQLINGEIHKQYLARVRGRVPDEFECTKGIGPLDKLTSEYGCLDEDQGGKSAHTRFIRQHYDPISDQSVVQCLPVTGRTHQIRLHLQFLGHAIANDPCYGGRISARDDVDTVSAAETVSDDNTGRVEDVTATAADTEEAAVTASTPLGGTQTEHRRKRPRSRSPTHKRLQLRRVPHLDQASGATTTVSDENSGGWYERVPGCTDCEIAAPYEVDADHCRGIYLHAWRYEGNGWQFETALPAWAAEGYVPAECEWTAPEEVVLLDENFRPVTQQQ
eukprot:TRINITY_DN6987_c0_g1_i1.p1 TRINITY_DN6987_c0_g1~~TRINITY_DN6987_c0_g1_i1.p1  ORF type:complete len:505 (+),score=75.03 TRINITY_DN6987_c0_g1_i1:112-1515(+)